METEKIDYKALQFGLALGHAAMDPASVPDFLNPGVFDAIEMPTECFLHRDYEFQRRFASCKFKTVRAGHLMAPDLARNIPFLAENYRRDFAEQAGLMVRTLSEAGASGAFLGFDMRRILGDEAAENAALEINAVIRSNAVEIVRGVPQNILRFLAVAVEGPFDKFIAGLRQTVERDLAAGRDDIIPVGFRLISSRSAHSASAPSPSERARSVSCSTSMPPSTGIRTRITT